MSAVVGHAKGMFKAGGAAVFGLLTGGAMMYGRAAFEKVSKVQPLANFSVAEKDGLKVTFHNQAAGDTGYWDFGDGSSLEPFALDAPVAHTYPKPGSYTAKLTVRNFLMEEKDRSVSVEVEGSAAAAPGLLPVLDLQVTPVGRSVVPATYHLTGKVENVDRAYLDLGDKMEVAESGPIDKYIVIDRPTRHPTPIQLIGHSGKQVVKQSVVVEVKEDKVGGISAVVRTVDAGTRVEKATWQETVPVSAAKGAKGFEKLAGGRPGFTLTGVQVGTPPKGVKGLAAAVAPDKRGVKLTGEWADGAGEALVPLTVTGERAVPVRFPQMTAVPFDAAGAVVPLPPRPRDVTGLTRTVTVELRTTGPDGQSKPFATSPDLKTKWEQPTTDGKMIRAEVVGEQVRVTVGR